MVKLCPHRQLLATFKLRIELGMSLINWSCQNSLAYIQCSILKPYFQASSASPEPIELPPSAMENQPVISPLTFLTTKWIPSSSGPKQMALVQWLRLHPDDTTWEEWSELKVAYHLEDKVLLDGLGNDTANTGGLQEARTTRPKRKSGPPAYLKDYA